jgi:hypothetical protein
VHATGYGAGVVDWVDAPGSLAGLAPGRTAAVRYADARRRRTVTGAGRVASVIADNLRTHTVASARLVRRMLSASSGQLCLSSTPADDPDANRIVWLWRISRRAVTQNHHREAWDGLRAAFEQHARRLAQCQDDILCHPGSAFASDEGRAPEVALAA